MKSIIKISDKIINLIDFYIRKIDGKINKTLEFYILIENIETKQEEWLRIVIYAYTTYRVIAYTICENKNDSESVTLFSISSDHDSTWRYQPIENILKDEKRNSYQYEGFIDSLYLCTGFVEKNFKENILFVENENTKLLKINI